MPATGSPWRDPIAAAIERIVGATVHDPVRIHGGYTPAERWTFRSGAHRCFAKAGVTLLTAALLRREIQAYAALHGDFLPKVIGHDDASGIPVLVLEDLSGAEWPPPWSLERVGAVVEALRELHASRAALPTYAEVHGARGGHWAEVAREPAAFLALGLVSPAWLQASLPALVDAEAACRMEGTSPCHWDVRSDNLCFRGGRAILVDWAEACLSNPDLDLGFWLPSLAHEGGPEPEALLPDRPDIAAWVSGFFAARAGLAPIPDAPRVRVVQRQQLAQALPWAARALGLGAPRAA